MCIPFNLWRCIFWYLWFLRTVPPLHVLRRMQFGAGFLVHTMTVCKAVSLLLVFIKPVYNSSTSQITFQESMFNYVALSNEFENSLDCTSYHNNSNLLKCAALCLQKNNQAIRCPAFSFGKSSCKLCKWVRGAQILHYAPTTSSYTDDGLYVRKGECALNLLNEIVEVTNIFCWWSHTLQNVCI